MTRLLPPRPNQLAGNLRPAIWRMAVAVLAAGCSALPALAQMESDEAFLDQLIRDGDIPGLSIAVVSRGDVVDLVARRHAARGLDEVRGYLPELCKLGFGEDRLHQQVAVVPVELDLVRAQHAHPLVRRAPRCTLTYGGAE